MFQMQRTFEVMDIPIVLSIAHYIQVLKYHTIPHEYVQLLCVFITFSTLKASSKTSLNQSVSLSLSFPLYFHVCLHGHIFSDPGPPTSIIKTLIPDWLHWSNLEWSLHLKVFKLIISEKFFSMKNISLGWLRCRHFRGALLSPTKINIPIF
jgi:hypothetical protein